MRSSPPSSSSPRKGGGLPSLDVSYNLFYSLINRFLPSIFSDTDFIGLRAIFRSFRLLLLYFDPQLAQHVDHHNILPELYATPWFITLFARDCHLDVLYFLWDVYLIEDDPFFHYFLALALLVQQRDHLLSLDASALPISLRQLRLSSLLTLLSKARSLREQTPVSMRQHLYDITFTVKQAEVMEIISTYDSLLPSLSIPASEVVQQAAGVGVADGEGGGVKLVLVDVREKRQWENGRLPTAHHINPCALFEEGKLQQVMAEFAPLKGQHLCFIGADVRTYATLLAMATASGSGGAADAVAAMPMLDGFLAAIRSTSMEAEEAHRTVLTPRELIGMERDDMKRESAKKWQQGKGAAPPVAAVVTAQKATRSPSPAPRVATATPPPSVAPALAVPANTATPTSQAAVASAANGVSGMSEAAPAPAADSALNLSFPAVSPLMDPYTASFVHVFLQHGFPHISVCEGGYPACHDLILNTKKQKAKPVAAAVSPAPPQSAAAASAAAIDLVGHYPINCLCCSPHLYEKWREDKKKRQEEAERKAERERAATEKKARDDAEKEKREKERLAKAEQEKKVREEAAAERQRRRDAGEVVEEPVEPPASAPVAVVASEKLNSFKRWLSDKSKPITAGRHSPSPSAVTTPVDVKEGDQGSPGRQQTSGQRHLHPTCIIHLLHLLHHVLRLFLLLQAAESGECVGQEVGRQCGCHGCCPSPCSPSHPQAEVGRSVGCGEENGEGAVDECGPPSVDEGRHHPPLHCPRSPSHRTLQPGPSHTPRPRCHRRLHHHTQARQQQKCGEGPREEGE